MNNLTIDSVIKEFLDEKYDKYNQLDFIEHDPISIPHQFTKQEDIEISGFLSASIAWGKRQMIIRNANKLIAIMGNSPHDFVLNASKIQLERFAYFKHRTFNSEDAQFFILSLQNIYRNKGGLQTVFEQGFQLDNSAKSAIAHFREVFFEINHPSRTQKHISNVIKKSAAKRINMYLRWMARKDNRGVDFGIWNIPNSELMMPLDVHTGNCGRKLNLLSRKQNDWQAVEELTNNLKQFDPTDPVKYDFSLFGIGVNEQFCKDDFKD